MKRLFVYLKPYLGRMFVSMSVKFGGSIMDLFLPWILAYVIDTVAPREDKRALAFWGVMMFLCSVLAILGNIAANRMAAAVARDTTRAIRHDRNGVGYIRHNRIAASPRHKRAIGEFRYGSTSERS